MILYFQLWVKRRGNQKRTYEKKLFLISLFHRSFWRKKYNESSERDLNPHAGFGKRVCCLYITRAFSGQCSSRTNLIPSFNRMPLPIGQLSIWSTRGRLWSARVLFIHRFDESPQRDLNPFRWITPTGLEPVSPDWRSGHLTDLVRWGDELQRPDLNRHWVAVWGRRLSCRATLQYFDSGHVKSMIKSHGAIGI